MHTQRATLAASLLGIAALLASAAAPAAVIYNEAFDGDLSNAPGAPTSVGTLALGTSTVTGRLANNFENGTEDPLDVFSFVVAAGTQVSAITLNFDQALYRLGANIALFSGPSSNSPNPNLGALNTVSSGLLDGGSLFTPSALGAIGPLGAGSYTFDMRGIGQSNGLTSYSFNLSVIDPNAQPVPEPASGLLVAASLLALGATRARRRT